MSVDENTTDTAMPLVAHLSELRDRLLKDKVMTITLGELNTRLESSPQKTSEMHVGSIDIGLG